MPFATFVRRRPRSSIAMLVATVAVGAWAPGAPAVIVANNDPMAAPLNGYVGTWNGSSAVCIAPNWIASAKHVNGVVGGLFTMRGQQYRAVEIIQHATQDIELIRVAETLPGFHRLATGVATGDLAILGGWGVTNGNPIANGYDWTGARRETWGANTIEGFGSLLIVRFDNPTSAAAVPHEAIFAVNDSGAGLFVYAPDGSLELAGIANSVTGFGQSVYGNAAFCLSVDMMRPWIESICAASAGINSSVEAPRQ